MQDVGSRIERRAFERIMARCPVKFRTERENELVDGSSKDLSDSGMGLFTRSKLKPNMHLEVWIEVASQVKPLQINAKVIWAQEATPELWRAGVCFSEMAFIKVMKMLVAQ